MLWLDSPYYHQMQIVIWSLRITHWSPSGYNQEQKLRGVKCDIRQERMSVHLKNFYIALDMTWCGWPDSFDVVLFLFYQSWGFSSFLFFFLIFPTLRGGRLIYAWTMLCRTDTLLCTSISFLEAFLVHQLLSIQFNSEVSLRPMKTGRQIKMQTNRGSLAA